MDATSIELLAQQRLAETGLSPAELLSLDMADYARLTGRLTPTQAALAALDAQYEPPGSPRQDPAPAQTAPQAPEPQGIDVASLDMEQYAQLRGQLGMGRGREYGRGILDGGGTAEWVAAAQAKGGRHGWQAQNVVESPRIDRAYVQPDPVDSRPAVQRFTTPGNLYGS